MCPGFFQPLALVWFLHTNGFFSSVWYVSRNPYSTYKSTSRQPGTLTSYTVPLIRYPTKPRLPGTTSGNKGQTQVTRDPNQVTRHTWIPLQKPWKPRNHNHLLFYLCHHTQRLVVVKMFYLFKVKSSSHLHCLEELTILDLICQGVSKVCLFQIPLE